MHTRIQTLHHGRDNATSIAFYVMLMVYKELLLMASLLTRGVPRLSCRTKSALFTQLFWPHCLYHAGAEIPLTKLSENFQTKLSAPRAFK